MTDKVLVTPAELHAMMGPGVVVIDTRSPDAYAVGHIPGAVNVHEIFTYLATSTPDGMAELRGKFAAAFGAAGLSGAETAVCYEESMNGGFGQSCRGYFLLSWLGYQKAKVLHGGMHAWKAAGMEATTEPTVAQGKTFPLSNTGSDMMIDRDAMLAAVGDSGIVKLDVRDVDEWVAPAAARTAPTSAHARAASPARSGWNGIA
jgi:thiosulfate/3-mercaptopyruvate sulfurtransferase